MILSDVLTCTVPPLRVESSLLKNPIPPNLLVHVARLRSRNEMASSIAEYFDGNVKSLANVRHGAKFSVGIIAPGEYRFGTEAAERMNVTCGEILVKQDGAEAFTCYPQGTCWEVAPKSGFTVKVALPAAYYCQYL